MDFKSLPRDNFKFSIFDADQQEQMESNLAELENKNIEQKDIDDLKNTCEKIEYYCSNESMIYAIKQIELLCPKLKLNVRLSIYLFNKSLISKDSFIFLINLYSSPHLPENFRWILLPLFIEASFHYPAFSICFCQYSSALNFLLSSFADFSQHKGHLSDIFKLIYNIVYDASSFFPISYIIKLSVNVFKNKSATIKVKEKVSSFFINFFRSYTANELTDMSNPENRKMVEILGNWFHDQSGFTFEHMLWAYYFWFRNTPNFMPIFFQTPFYHIVMNHLFNFDNYNDVHIKILLYMLSLALTTDDNNYLAQIYQSLPIQNVILLIFTENINISEETKIISLCVCSNYAVHGISFIQNLLNFELHFQIFNHFDNFSFPIKIEFCYCITNMIINGNHDQVSCFANQGFVEMINEFFEMQDLDLTLSAFISISKLIDINTNVLNYIDIESLEDASKELLPNSEVELFMTKIMSLINSNNYQ